MSNNVKNRNREQLMLYDDFEFEIRKVPVTRGVAQEKEKDVVKNAWLDEPKLHTYLKDPLKNTTKLILKSHYRDIVFDPWCKIVSADGKSLLGIGTINEIIGRIGLATLFIRLGTKPKSKTQYMIVFLGTLALVLGLGLVIALLSGIGK